MDSFEEVLLCCFEFMVNNGGDCVGGRGGFSCEDFQCLISGVFKLLADLDTFQVHGDCVASVLVDICILGDEEAPVYGGFD